MQYIFPPPCKVQNKKVPTKVKNAKRAIISAEKPTDKNIDTPKHWFNFSINL